MGNLNARSSQTPRKKSRGKRIACGNAKVPLCEVHRNALRICAVADCICGLFLADRIVRILSCGLYCADCIMWIVSRRLYWIALLGCKMRLYCAIELEALHIQNGDGVWYSHIWIYVTTGENNIKKDMPNHFLCTSSKLPWPKTRKGICP